jgi:hypothetical protein
MMMRVRAVFSKFIAIVVTMLLAATVWFGRPGVATAGLSGFTKEQRSSFSTYPDGTPKSKNKKGRQKRHKKRVPKADE